MLSRLLVGALVWVAAMTLLVVGLQDSARARRPGPEYVVTHTASYQRVTVVTAKIRRGADRMAVAQAIVTPLRAAHADEVLIYLHEPAQPGTTLLRRIQWSPRGGYQELLIK